MNVTIILPKRVTDDNDEKNEESTSKRTQMLIMMSVTIMRSEEKNVSDTKIFGSKTNTREKKMTKMPLENVNDKC